MPGDPDFIELINISGKMIDANRLSIVSVNEETNDTSDVVHVSDTGRCILPGGYYAITDSKKNLMRRYFKSADSSIFLVASLPSMPDDKGHLVLISRSDSKIDEVSYNEDMHFPLLTDAEGISLEKIRPGSNSMDRTNWHSASESAGWATPGMINSVFTEKPESDQRMLFSSSRITPDNDGYEDILVIDFRLAGQSNVVNILIFDENGDLVRKLAQNLYTGSNFSVNWDGTADDGSILNSGIYVILVRIFDETGHTVSWKKACALIR
jgi:hypothetical protein